MPRRYPSELRSKALGLIAGGSTQLAAAQEMGIDRTTIRAWLKEAEQLPAQPRAERRPVAPAPTPAAAPPEAPLSVEVMTEAGDMITGGPRAVAELLLHLRGARR